MKLLKLIVLSLFSCNVYSQDNNATKDLWPTIEKEGKIQLATEGAFSPLNFYKGKTLTGFEVELGDALIKEMGLTHTWKTFPFEGLLIGLDQGKFHMVIASHGITEERAKSVDFSNPHYCTGGVIIALDKDDKTIKSIKDLEGKRVGVQVATTYYRQAAELSGIKELKTFPKDSDSLSALMGKKIDAIITDRFVAMEMTKKQKGLKLGDLVFEEKIGIAVKKGQTKLLEKVNESLKKLINSGKYEEISLKWFDENISCKN